MMKTMDLMSRGYIRGPLYIKIEIVVGIGM